MKIFNYKLQFIHCYQVQKPRHVDSERRPRPWQYPHRISLLFLCPFLGRDMRDIFRRSDSMSHCDASGPRRGSFTIDAMSRQPLPFPTPLIYRSSAADSRGVSPNSRRGAISSSAPPPFLPPRGPLLQPPRSPPFRPPGLGAQWPLHIPSIFF
jgi:hypothetical protein